MTKNLFYAMMLSTSAFGTDILSPNENQRWLGHGYNVQEQRIVSECITGKVISIDLEKTNLKVGYGESLSDFIERYNGRLRGSIDLGIISGKASREFLIRNTETNKSASAIWLIDYQSHVESLINPRLNEIGNEARLLDPDEKSKICGNRVVHSQEIGAKTLLSLNLRFNSSEKYRWFKTKVKASAFGGLVKKSKTTIEEFQEFAEEGLLEVSALQIGGDTKELDRLKSAGQISCKTNDMEPCIDTFNRLFEYVRSRQYRMSLSDKSNLASFVLATDSYEQLAIFDY
ncbi:hypothetical protein [Pseudobacteriovorax antillogorgiicola]|uniref:Uncharacterized protein n=1 Tax=Pseudobacteriovorax antillogorgiicola TaxID=1513793 RepID=A0A1Y6B7U0_9BACT|nr:hypothetical protein [Pseudobacteriovorax antillogorgiicola]TCS58744.1 hypothetical protein EDD56_102258 [Pseudobacteriovorax antillogorgiicola]SME95222.1 hypothetical protein SAMN06296036_102185 [Pseudobacteriovorax antillogorgiicola]